MWHVIAGTDFTPASLNACRYAALLAEQTEGKLILFNLYKAPVVHENAELAATERTLAEKEIVKVKEQLKSEFNGLQIETELGSGSFLIELDKLVKKKGKSILVFGIKPKNWAERFFYGSHSLSLAGHVNIPVIVVPQIYREHHIKKMALAVDAKEDIFDSSLRTIAKFSDAAKLKLTAVHVNTEKEKAALPDKSITIGEKTVRVHVIDKKKIDLGIAQFCVENNVDLLAILSKSHSVLENIFSESHTKHIAYNSKIPVLAIHIGK